MPLSTDSVANNLRTALHALGAALAEFDAAESAGKKLPFSEDHRGDLSLTTSTLEGILEDLWRAP